MLSLLGFITSMVKVFQVESLYGSGDLKMVAGVNSNAILVLLIGTVIGFVGVFLAGLVLRGKKERSSWFFPVSTFFAWMRIIFAPISTVIGMLMLRWRRPEPPNEYAAHA